MFNRLTPSFVLVLIALSASAQAATSTFRISTRPAPYTSFVTLHGDSKAALLAELLDIFKKAGIKQDPDTSPGVESYGIGEPGSGLNSINVSLDPSAEKSYALYGFITLAPGGFDYESTVEAGKRRETLRITDPGLVFDIYQAMKAAGLPFVASHKGGVVKGKRITCRYDSVISMLLERATNCELTLP